MHLFLSRGARRALELDPPAAPPSGDKVIGLFESFRVARGMADRLAPRLPPEAPRVAAGDLYALGRIERALRLYLNRFVSGRDPNVLARALLELEDRFGTETIDRLLDAFADEFLPDQTDSFTPDAATNALDPGRRADLLGELLVFSIIHSNPACSRLVHLLHFGGLVADANYDPVISALGDILSREPGLYADDENLIRGLRRPIEAAPSSLADQLRWLLEAWRGLEAGFEDELVAALDLIAEEEAPRFPAGPGPAEVPVFDYLEPAGVHYGTDRGWMSRLVLAAKNSYVWLHQLSSRYGREITRLDQIPDEELRLLAERGFTGLWLIGIWERSRASERIKQLCGNPEAAGSAYSLIAYRIAEDLGGDEALAELAERAGRFGIRLSADMVPNHTGIDSDWLIEHPERFVSVPVCPFPAYRFEGPDLSPDPRVGIFLEDHYFDRSDAAVVFKRVDNETGEVRFVYHGNDGTGMPWNDTAQLDYLNAGTREAVTETILGVARRFPIIRFDAAMTLARRHVQRLWHPEPGSAGAIPSRAEHTLTTTEFNKLMPAEFWREVVDRAQVEAPDTLLLAEAFWLMEGYFVRNLGLHRVYNSAFMNMLRDGDNRGYRRLVRESLDFDPEILRRYVNFLSNPDEDSAIEQFGDGDRYFGACVLLATMPGLPMFAHGQIEGLRERYGMEYRRAYVEESVNQGLVDRHAWEIFPLLRERERFSGVDDLSMHDFVGGGGAVVEDVLAFSRGADDDTAIVVFNNRSAPVRGVLKLDRDLGMSARADHFCAFRDRLAERFHLRPAPAVHDRGLELELGGYQSAILVDFREVHDRHGRLARLEQRFGLGGVPSLEEAERELDLDDGRTAFADVLATLSVAAPKSGPAMLAVDETLGALYRLLDTATRSPERPGAVTHGQRGLEAWLEAISRLAAVEQALDWPRTERMLAALERLLVGVEEDEDAAFVLAAFALVGDLERRSGTRALAALDPGRPAGRVLAERGVSEDRAKMLTALVDLASTERWLEPAAPPGRSEAAELLAATRDNETLGTLLGYDRTVDTVSGPLLDRFLTWRATAAAMSWLAKEDDQARTATDPLVPSGDAADHGEGLRSERAEAVVGWCDALDFLRGRIADADLQIEPVLARLRGD